MHRSVLIALLLILLALPAAATTPGELLVVEYGVANGFNLDSNKIGAGHLFGIGLILSSKLEADFIHIMSDGANLRNYNLLRLNLYLKDKVGIGLSMGSENSNNLATGLGLFFDLYHNKKFGLTTVFQLRFDYMITRSVNTTGTLMVGLSAKLGI